MPWLQQFARRRVCALLIACSGPLEAAPEFAPDFAPARAPASVPGSWARVDALAADAFAKTPPLRGMGLVVYDANDNKVFEKMYGDFSADRRVPVASASKIVSGTVLLRLAGRGLLSLDSTTAQVLGWSGTRGTITLRHLLSFTSGLEPNAPCINNPFITLAQCVEQVGSNPGALVAAPGSRYDYGSTHLHVAARMAEVATGKTWNRLFADELAMPLGLPAQATYYTLVQQGTGTINPRVAGGLHAAMNEYAPLLALSFHRGTYKGVTYAPAALFDAQAVEPYPGVTVGISPVKNLGLSFRYGLSAWLGCTTPATGCSTISSPGAYGWTPWVDRQAGYYAILGMNYDDGASNGVVNFSVMLEQQLQPEIRKALGK